MQTTLPAERVDIDSGGTRCAAWLTTPNAPGPHPAVVLAHGLGATHDMMLATYEQRFAAAGIATLAFDYRCTGDSDGLPRQHISLRDQRDDVISAVAWLRARSGIDPGRIALWGTSLGALNVVGAAVRTDIAAAVIQCPIVHGPAAARRLGTAAVLRIAPAIAADLLRRLLRRNRRYIPIVGEPGTRAMVTVAGALAGWNSTVPPGARFDNRIAAADATALVTTSVLRAARKVRAPLLVCACDRETLMDPKYSVRVAHAAPSGVLKRYPSDHFEIYHPPLVDTVLADQISFLREHLHVRG
jgi:alpha-beta hydrolase superfamily lysophospholipase